MNYYDKINWKNRSEGKTTKISAERLNHMDNQILNNANAIGNVEKIADIGDGTLCGAAETLKETAEKLNQSLGNIVSFNGSTDGIKIFKGDKTITFTQKNVTNFAQIVFDKKFSQLPSVQLTANDLGRPEKVSLGIQNLTASGFVITGINTVDTDSVNVQWFAIGI